MIVDLIGTVELTICVTIVVGGVALGIGRGLRQRLMVGLVLAVWFVGVTTLGATQVLHSSPSDPLGVRLTALARLGVTVMLPIFILCGAAILVRSLRQGLERMPIWGLVALNVTRILGVSFLVLYAQNRLPAPFAPVAGWGDILVGLAAIPVARLAAGNIASAQRLVFAWNVIGLADLVAAIGLGMTASMSTGWHPAGPGSSTMTLLPWLFIPGFLVPLLATSHIAIFHKLARQARGNVQARSA